MLYIVLIGWNKIAIVAATAIMDVMIIPTLVFNIFGSTILIDKYFDKVPEG